MHLIRPLPLPSASLPIHSSLIVLPFDAIQSQLLRASLNKPQMNKYFPETKLTYGPHVQSSELLVAFCMWPYCVRSVNSCNIRDVQQLDEMWVGRPKMGSKFYSHLTLTRMHSTDPVATAAWFPHRIAWHRKCFSLLESVKCDLPLKNSNFRICVFVGIAGFFGLCPSSDILKNHTTEHNVSETGSVSLHRRGEEGPLGRALCFESEFLRSTPCEDRV
jgi:hypothetical protein